MENKKIYICCPANFATGGPELLHQLCYKLNLFGYSAYMYYYDIKKDMSPVHERFAKYNNNFVNKIEDFKENIVIVPEIKINLLKKYKNAKKVIWWLSVDNYFVTRESLSYKFKYLFGIREFNYKSKEVFHFAQSFYAIDFLLKQNISREKIFYLSDYLNESFIENSVLNINKTKQDYILYNPKKGYEFTKKIIEAAPNLKFKKIENMSPAEVAGLMGRSKIYIDFGNHPGKDRIPREAAINGCCIITGMKGSANYYKDLPINQEFKFKDCEENIHHIVEKMKYILENFNMEQEKFNLYRKTINSEEEQFEKDILSIFKVL